MNKRRSVSGKIGGLALSLIMAAALLVPAAAVSLPEATGPTRLVLLSKLDGPLLPEDLIVLEDYGEAFVLAEVSEAQLAALPETNIMDRMTDRTVISLNGTVWDTQQGEPAIADGLRSADDDPYFLVQFYGPVKNEWVTDLEAMGVTFLGYHPNYTYIVQMDPALLPKVEKAHAVQWVGRYDPAYRLAAEEELAKAERDGDKLEVEVRAFPGEDPGALGSRLEAAGVTVELIETNDPPVARVWAMSGQLPTLAALPGVYRVEPYEMPQTVNDQATQVMHTKYVWKASRNGLLQDLMGAGQMAGLVDSGLDNKTTSPNVRDFYDYTGGTTTSRVVYNQNSAACGGGCTCTATDDSNNGGHGTHVAGSMVGNGYLSLQQRGLTGHATAADPSFDYAFAAGQAPEARIAVVHTGASGGGLCISASTDWTTLYNQGARATNNSWGTSTTTYGGNAYTADQIMWTYQDYLLVMSASNAGPGADTVCQPGTAKNILTVGASGNHRSVWEGDSQTSSLLTDFSSRGPITTGATGDTRFKPDIVATGADVLSTRTTAIANGIIGLWQNEPGDGDSNGYLDYAWSGGTSMSSPEVTGAAIIVRDYFQDIQGLGTTTPPSAALIKAALVNGAVDMGYGYETNTSTYPYGGRNMQGWGMANVEQSIVPRAPRSFFYDDFTNISSTVHKSTIGMDTAGDYVEYAVTVVDSSEPLKITTTWTDPQTGSSAYAVNNLNLLVTSPGSTSYYGNNLTGSWSNTTASYDSKNNTEAVYIQNPATGTWTIRVTGAAVSYATYGYQPFVLFVSGGLGVTPTYTRTCTGITSCTGRMGTSAQAHYPSLKPLSGAEEDTEAGTSFATSFRLTNWGTNSDTVSLSSSATDMTGGGVANITVSFSPTGPYSLASGASQDVVATVSVGSGVASGSYDLSITTVSAGTGSRKDVQVIGLNVLADNSLPNEMRLGADTISTSGAQVTPSFWACPTDPDNLWVAYLNAEDHSGSGAEVYAARSIDGGATWTKWQLDSGDRYHYYAPAIGGSADCSSVTAAWVRETSTVSTYSYWLYSRTYSGGTWGSVGTRDTLTSNANYYMADPAVIYDGDASTPEILLVWLHYTGTAASTGVYYSYSTNTGSTWTAAASAVTGAVHRYPAMTLDTTNNHVWTAFSYSGTTRDIYVKYWNGGTNAWNATNTVVANTANRENHPAIAYVNGALWVAWNRYTDYSNATAQLYYVRTTSTLPTITWGTTYGPYGARLAEHTPPAITADNSYTYIAYLAYTDSFRGANVYALRAPAAGGAPDTTYQLSVTVDDPPLYARGNAGSPRLMWAQTTVKGSISTGPTLLYTKNPPNSGNPDYGSSLGVAQTLYNLEENVDVYLSQVGTAPTAVELARFEAWPEGAAIHVEWETVTEVDLLGFSLYRSDAHDGPYAKLNEELIPAQAPGQPIGAAYSWLDSDVEAGSTYYYKLEDVDVYGTATMHEPVSATAWAARRIHLPVVVK